MEPGITKREKDGSVYITIAWSPLTRLTKDIINRRIPSVPGVFEILVDDGGRQLELIGRARAYYGGLRNTLRGMIDTISPYAIDGLLLDRSKPHYARYAMIETQEDMDDVLYFYGFKDGREDLDDSGRYEYIYLNEES